MGGYSCLETSELQVTGRCLRRPGKPRWRGVVSDCSAQPVPSESSDPGSGQEQRGSAPHTWHSPEEQSSAFHPGPASTAQQVERGTEGSGQTWLGWAGLDIGPRASICWETAALGASTGSVRLGLTSCHRNVDLHLGTRNKSLAGEQLSERQIFAASLPVYICSGVSPCERLVHFRRRTRLGGAHMGTKCCSCTACGQAPEERLPGAGASTAVLTER